MKRIFLAFVILEASVSLHALDIYVGQYNIRNANERDVQAFSDGVQVDVPENVGFDGSNYYLTIRMKAQLVFY